MKKSIKEMLVGIFLILALDCLRKVYDLLPNGSIFKKYPRFAKIFFPLQYGTILEFLAESIKKLQIQKGNVGNDCDASFVFLTLIAYKECYVAPGKLVKLVKIHKA